MKAHYTVTQEKVRLSARCPVRVQEVAVRDEIGPHDHEFTEVALVSGGVGEHITPGGRQPLSRGDLLVVRPGQVHGVENPRGLRVFNVYYLAEWLLRDRELPREAPRLCMCFLGDALFPGRATAAPAHLRLGEGCLERVWGEIGMLERLSRESAPDALLLRAGLLKCFAWWDREMAGRVDLNYTFIEHPVVRRVLDGIETSLSEGRPLDLSRLAAATGFSPDHLSRLFRALTGESPRECFQRRRLRRAAHALIHSSENLSEIAHRLGFSDSAHFSRRFKGAYGLSPLAYRRRFPSTSKAVGRG